MAYTFRYELQVAPSFRNDGSGCIEHEIKAQFSEDGGAWEYVPSRHKTVSIPGDALADVMAMPDGTAQERQAKNSAYKQLLVDYRDNTPDPIVGWNISQMEAMLDANTLSLEQAALANEYITVTLGQTYPLPFNL